MISGRKGTPNYMAPEVFKAKSGDEHSTKKYNELSDMWSIGIIAYILCTNKDPFSLWLAEGKFDEEENKPKTLNAAIKNFVRHEDAD